MRLDMTRLVGIVTMGMVLAASGVQAATPFDSWTRAAAARQAPRPAPTPPPASTARDEVRKREQAFAATMRDRDLKGFASFLSPEAVFFGPDGAQRGATAVVDAWSGFFKGPSAPFSWEPDTVEVLPSGDLALSSGPVMNPQGQRVGTFNSVWRRDADGVWRVVFDKGCPPCPCR